MGSPVTFSGFNNIDFKQVLTAVMAQERQPETTMTDKQSALQGQQSAYAMLATRVASFQSAASSLAAAGSLIGRSVTSTNSTALAVTAGSSTPIGTYDVIVKELARAQVTGSTSTHADSNSTVVATGGTLTIGGIGVTVSGATTLQGLADAINGTDNIGVTASIVQPTATTYQLVLTGNATGQSNGFTIQNSLTGGVAPVTFGTNAVEATNASVEVNKLLVSSSTNTLSSAIPGASITVQQKNLNATITVTVSQDTSNAKNLVQGFVNAYNDLAAFISNQQTASTKGDTSSIAHDGLLRDLSSQVRSLLSSSSPADGSYQYLANIGLGFSRTGQLTFDTGAFDTAATAGGLAHIQNLFTGSAGVDGIFKQLSTSISQYTAADGLLPTKRQSISDELSSIGNRIADFEARLAIRQAALQREYTATDQLMTSLNSSTSSLSNLNNQYRLF